MKYNKNILDLETRRKTYNFILKHPGLHLREISRKINLPYGTLDYHLNYLKKQELLTSKNDKRYTRFYAKQTIGTKEKQIISMLREETPRGIILILLAFVKSSQIELSKQLEKNPATISFHLKKLLNLEVIKIIEGEKGLILSTSPSIVDFNPVGNEIFYTLKDPEKTYNLLIKYGDSLFDDLKIKFVLDYVNDFLYDGLPETILGPKSSMESVEKTLWDIFPHPYHV